MKSSIRIEGLKEFQGALRKIDADLPKKLRVLFNEVAETVAAGARRRVPTKTGRAKASIKVASQQREAIIKGGGNKAPYYPFLEFGNKVGGGAFVGRGDSVDRPYRQAGRYLYPTFSANRQSVEAAMEKKLNELVEESGLKAED